MAGEKRSLRSFQSGRRLRSAGCRYPVCNGSRTSQSERVLGSLRLSMLTGPNEGYAMTERGIFGVSLWESLAPDLKRRVVLDLAGGGNE